MVRKVHVFSSDQTEDLGIGVHLGDTTLREEVENGNLEGPLEGPLELIADDPIPKIRLESSGDIVYGCICWWHDVEPAQN